MFHSETMNRVTRKNPCPICQHGDWCGYSETIAICMRVESDKPSKNGGWIHILNEKPIMPIFRKKAIPEVVKELDVDGLMSKWRQNTAPEQRQMLADALGVSMDALTRLDAVYAPEHFAWAFPMRNEHDAAIGIRLRSMDGHKWAVAGSHSGLFIPAGVQSGKRLLICEGPTDTAAGLSAGFDVIGRPSCRGNVETVTAWLKSHKFQEIVLIVDNDKYDKHGHRAGIEGAKALATELQQPYRLVMLPVKDLRQWTQQANKTVIDAIINSAKLQTNGK